VRFYSSYILTSLGPVFFVLLNVLVLTSCVPTRLQRELIAVQEAQQINPNAEYVKIHMHSGNVYVFRQWTINEKEELIYGVGGYYNANRKKIPGNQVSGEPYPVPFNEIALIETNKAQRNSPGGVAAFTIFSIPTTIISVICLTDPKACFGSCPTYYIEKGGEYKLQAEGFSSSIARVLEETDIDRIHLDLSPGQQINLQVKNEALETHVISYIDLFAYPLENNNNIYSSINGKFYTVDSVYNADHCLAREGSIKELVSVMDNQERFSLSDSLNLVKKETIEFTFNGLEEGRYGLLIGSRQTLMTTFLFYQALSYLGHSASFHFARLESGNRRNKKLVKRMFESLGGIDVYLENEAGRWNNVGAIKEMGPIASDVNMIVLPDILTDSLNMRLDLTQGLWRIDYLALARISEEVDPIRIKPQEVVHLNQPDTIALNSLLDTDGSLVTFPRDEYYISYQVPDPNLEYRYFIESRGYYYEWMRENWYCEEDQRKYRTMFLFPRYYFKKVAPQYKQRELAMEEVFWNSRYIQQNERY